MAVGMEFPLPPPVPALLMLTRVVDPATRSRRKVFNFAGKTFGNGRPLMPLTRLLAELEKTTKRPSGVMSGDQESPLAPAGGDRLGSRAEMSCNGAGNATIAERKRITIVPPQENETTFLITIYNFSKGSR